MWGRVHLLRIEWKRNHSGRCTSSRRSTHSLLSTTCSFLVLTSSRQDELCVGEIALLRPGISCMFKSKNEFQLANLSVSKRIVDSQEFLKKVTVTYCLCLLCACERIFWGDFQIWMHVPQHVEHGVMCRCPSCEAVPASALQSYVRQLLLEVWKNTNHSFSS
jgi:hypothetical protein